MIKWLSSIRRVDEATFYWATSGWSDVIGVQIPRWLSRSGDGYGYLIFCLIALALGDEDAQPLLLTLLLAFLIELPIYWLLKNTCRRPRPYQRRLSFKAAITASDQFSFPSGHTTAAFMFAGLAGAFMPTLAPLLLLWASLIGCSRVMLGVHYPTDIFAGALLGSSLAGLVLWQFNLW